MLFLIHIEKLFINLSTYIIYMKVVGFNSFINWLLSVLSNGIHNRCTDKWNSYILYK